jgi:hypothetical protein
MSLESGALLTGRDRGAMRYPFVPKSFLITTSSPEHCSLKQYGENAVQGFATPSEALAEVVRRFPQDDAEVTIADEMTGSMQRIRIERDRKHLLLTGLQSERGSS